MLLGNIRECMYTVRSFVLSETEQKHMPIVSIAARKCFKFYNIYLLFSLSLLQWLLLSALSSYHSLCLLFNWSFWSSFIHIKQCQWITPNLFDSHYLTSSCKSVHLTIFRRHNLMDQSNDNNKMNKWTKNWRAESSIAHSTLDADQHLILMSV